MFNVSILNYPQHQIKLSSSFLTHLKKCSTLSVSKLQVEKRPSKNVLLESRRAYAKKPPALTEAQIQFQKHTAELNLRERTTIRDTRFEFHSVETSIQYMESEAFKKAYGEKLIWEWYIRNFKGRFPKSWTRKQCVSGEKYITGNPCPICRDPYLVVNHKNSKLLSHFVSPFSGHLYPTSKTSVCQKQHENLEIAFEKACDHGLIDHFIPHREFDYSEYFSADELKELSSVNEAHLGFSFDHLLNKEKPSVLLGLVLGANRKNTVDILHNLDEHDIQLEAANTSNNN